MKKSKISVTLSKEIVSQLKQQSTYQDRSVSWLLERAWKLSKRTIEADGAIFHIMKKDGEKE